MKQVFSAVIKQHEGMDAAYIEIPFDVQQAFGAKRVKVLAEFDGYPYRGSIVSMGGCYLLGITQQIRKAISKDFNDVVQVSIEKDMEAREVELIDEFRQAQESNSTACSFWETLSYTNKRMFADWVSEAKRKETRIERIEKSIAKLSDHTTLK